MGGTPPPLYGQNFRQIGGYGFGGYPPPFTDKIRKVVFEVLPYSIVPLCEGSETLIECKSMYCQIYGRTDGMTGVGAGDTSRH